MPGLTEELLLDQLRKEDNAAFRLLYESYFPSTANYIRQNNGDTRDAEDIFQEAVVVLLGKIRQPDFVPSSSLKTYLFAISKNLWLKQLRRDKQYPAKSLLDITDTIFANDDPVNEQRLSAWLQKITAHCRQILKAIFFFNEPIDSLMLKMGWKNKHTAANQKYKCIEQVRKESKK